VRDGLADREQRFLDVLARDVYGHPSSPYLRLLRLSGCELGDVTRLVAADGVEDALARLRDAGVYLTFDEFKGRRDVVRGGARFRIREADFDRPGVQPALPSRTGGSRGPATQVHASLAFLTDQACAGLLAFDAHDLLAAEQIVWLGSPGLAVTLQYARMGRRPRAWFYPLGPLHRGTRVAAWYLASLSRLVGRPLPAPRLLDMSRPDRLAARLAVVGRDGPVCLTTYASSAVRVARAAQERGIDLSAVTFVTVGEPFTGAKRAALQAVGARALVRYTFMEAGVVGLGCGTPRAADDLHFHRHAYALIQRTRAVGEAGPTVESLLFTSLLPSAPKVLLNVESGDCARIVQRECDCRLGAAGLTTHLDSVRSFEKLTGEGMTFIQLDLLRVLEEVLPARFGGSGSDYQVVEEEDPDGIMRLVLSVDPRVGAVDPDVVRAAFHAALARQPGVAGTGVEVWRRAGTVRVVRRSPVATAAGKVLPLHVAPRERSGASRP
jgi:hypothetical protein